MIKYSAVIAEIILISMIFFISYKYIEPQLLPSVFNAGAGASLSLPHEVILMKTFADNNDMKDFRSIGTLNVDPGLSQRSSEFLYPVRRDAYSINLFVKHGEPVPNNCVLKNSSEGLDYYVCFK